MDADDAEPVCLAVFEEEADNDNDENKTTGTYSILSLCITTDIQTVVDRVFMGLWANISRVSVNFLLIVIFTKTIRGNAITLHRDPLGTMDCMPNSR